MPAGTAAAGRCPTPASRRCGTYGGNLDSADDDLVSLSNDGLVLDDQVVGGDWIRETDNVSDDGLEAS